jgi:multiple antibiotic resistance protein
MLGALWGGAYVLNFFGISLAALRSGGGFVIASSAWALLHRPEQTEERKHEQASHATGEDDVAFYPLTMPFTTGPGTIAVAIAIGSNLPVGGPGAIPFALGASAAAVAIAAIILIAYSWADRLVAFLGAAQARVVTRLSAFLLLCVGVQITLNGTADFVRSL